MKLLTLLPASLFWLALSSVNLLAQPGLPPNPTQAPIDGGLSLVALAGGAYAWKKYRNHKNANDKPGEIL